MKQTPAQPTTNTTPQPPKPRVRMWFVCRIENYQLAALDLDGEFTPLSERTYVSADRETAYQTARQHGGLLTSADALPGVAAYTRFQAGLVAARTTAADAAAKEDADE